jgi:hypothetical protein
MWECPKCHEMHEHTFDACWNCGTSKEGVEPTKPQAALIRCTKCGSDKVVPRATIWDRLNRQGSRESLTACVFSSPEALSVFKGPAYAALFARICADCGYAELYAEGAERLYQAYQRSLENS